jgi:hypothetical protein
MLAVIATALGVALVAVAAIGGAALLRIRGRAWFALAALVLGAGDVVLCSTLVSLFHGLTRPGILLALLVVAAAVAAAWLRAGRPHAAWTGRIGLPARPWELRGVGLAAVVLAALALLVNLYLLMRVAPSNWDSMTYHLSRAAYWLQERSVGQFTGGSVRQRGSGPDAEILVAWTMLLSGTDRWVELVQWISLGGLGLAVFAGARMLRFDVCAAAFAGAIFVLLPQPLLQSTTTQNDLVAALFVALTALFVARGLRDRRLGDLAVGGGALGLALGTKGTAFIALPSLAVIALGALVAWRPPRSVVLSGIGLAVCGVVAFGAYNYVLNVKYTHSVFGGVDEKASSSGGFDNAVEDMWTFADSPGVDVSFLDPIVARAGRRVLGPIIGYDYPYTIDTTVQEDTSAFGLVGFLVLPLLLLVALLAPRGPPARRLLALAAIVYLAVFGLNEETNAWLARVMIPGVALAAPLFAMLARRSALGGLVLGLAVISAGSCVLQNAQKPLLVPVGSGNALSWSRLQQMTIGRPDMAPTLQAVDAAFGPHARLAIVAREDEWDYPFFGAHRDRHIVRLTDPSQATPALMRRERLDGVVYLNWPRPAASLHPRSIGDHRWLVRAPGRQS